MIETRDEQAEFEAVAAIFDRPELLPELDESLIVCSAPRIVYNGLHALISHDMPITPSAMREACSAHAIAGEQALDRMYESNKHELSAIIRRLKLLRDRRNLYELSVKFSKMVESDDPSDALAYIRNQSESLTVSDSGKEKTVSSQEVLDEILEDVLNMKPRACIGEPTGLMGGVFDHITQGIQRDNLTILGAFASTGKSTLATHLCLSFTQLHKKAHPLIMQTESASSKAALKQLAILGRVDYLRMMQGRLTPEEKARVREIHKTRRMGRVHLHNCHGYTMGKLESTLRLHQMKYGLSLVIVDMMANLYTGDADEISKMRTICDGLKRIKTKLDCHIIGCAHIRKPGNEGQDREPTMADLLGSQSLSGDPDAVWMLHRPSVFGGESANTKLIIAKSRDGLGGTSLEYRMREDGELVAC